MLPLNREAGGRAAGCGGCNWGANEQRLDTLCVLDGGHCGARGGRLRRPLQELLLPGAGHLHSQPAALIMMTALQP
jgi:hypothetical protein